MQYPPFTRLIFEMPQSIIYVKRSDHGIFDFLGIQPVLSLRDLAIGEVVTIIRCALMVTHPNAIEGAAGRSVPRDHLVLVANNQNSMAVKGLWDHFGRYRAVPPSFRNAWIDAFDFYALTWRNSLYSNQWNVEAGRRDPLVEYAPVANPIAPIAAASASAASVGKARGTDLGHGAEALSRTPLRRPPPNSPGSRETPIDLDEDGEGGTRRRGGSAPIGVGAR